MTSPAAPPSPRDGWLFGPRIDLLLGCGLAYLLTAPFLLLLGDWTGTTQWPALLVTAMAVAVNSPHYGATLVRVYETRDDRRTYVVFTVWLTLALAVLLGFAAHSVWLGSVLITAYVLWSPWHFSGQNYGLALLFLRRRRIEVEPSTKRLIHVSFVLSALLAILALHAGRDVVFVPQTLAYDGTPTLLRAPLPIRFVQLGFAAALLAYLACLATAGWRLGRRASFGELAPSLLLVLTQALWFTVPALLDFRGARGETLIFAAIWISTAHSIQYLWVSAYYARDSGAHNPVGRFLVKCFAAGTALSAALFFLLAPAAFGRVAADVGLAATIFAVINLHHFILDGAIWKLRDGRVARVLLRAREVGSSPEPVDARVRMPWLRALVWGVAGLAVAAQAAAIYASQVMSKSDRPEQIERAMQILRWTGKEGVGLQLRLGVRLAQAGETERAIASFRRSIELFPTARAWAELGGAYQAQGRNPLALEAFDTALELNPDFWGAHQRRAEVLLALDPARSPQTLAAAIASLERAVALAPERPETARLLAELRRQRMREPGSGSG